MDYLVNQYKMRVRSLLQPQKFISYKKSFYRIKNDVLQFISLQKDKYGHAFTINIGIDPLYIKVDLSNVLGDGDFRIGDLVYGSDEWYNYNKNDYKSIDTALDLVMKHINEYLLPFFWEISDSKKKYDFICNLELKKYNKIISGTADKLFINLKNKEYYKSLYHISEIEKYYYYSKFCNQKDDIYGMEQEDSTDINIDDIMDDLKEELSIKEAILCKDYEFIANLLLENEKYSLSKLLK